MELLFLLLPILATAWGAPTPESSKPAIEPLDYQLTFQIDAEKGQIKGDADITIQLNEQLEIENPIKLDGEELTVTRWELWQNVVKAEGDSPQTGPEIIINSSVVLYPNTYHIKLSFNKDFDESSSGILKSSYDSKSSVIVANIYPNNAHKVFPCFNDPSLLANFTINVTTTSGWTAYSNMPKKTTSENSTLFETTPQISTSNVVFFIVKEYDIQVVNERVQVHYPINAKTNLTANTVLQSFVKDTYFEDLTPDYKFDEIKFVMIPGLPVKAATYYGVVALRPELMVQDVEATTKERSEMTLELLNAKAKLYFGAIVVPATQADSWLSNSPAIFLQFKAMRKMPEWGDRYVDNLEYVIMRDALTKDPIKGDQTFESTGIKGAGFLRMLEDFDKVDMEQFLWNVYFVQTVHTSVTTDEFLDLLAKYLNNSEMTKSNLEFWVKNKDFPTLRVSVNKDSGANIVIEPNDKHWNVPVRYITSLSPKSSETQLMLSVANINKQQSWTLINSDGKGLYQVLYDGEHYTNLSEAVEKNIIESAIQRSELLSSVFYFVAEYDGSDNTTLDDFIDKCNVSMTLTNNMINEYDYAPWSVFTSGIIRFRNILFTGYDNKGFMNRLRTLADIPYAYFGLTMKKSDDNYANVRRQIIVDFACEIGHEMCQKESLHLFSEIKPEDYEKFIMANGPDTVQTIKCTGVNNMSSEDWEKYFKAIYNLTAPNKERERALDILACGKDDSITKLFEKMTGNEIKNDDKFEALGAIYKRPNNVDRTMTYIKSLAPFPEDEAEGWSQVFEGIGPMLYTKNYFDMLIYLRDGTNGGLRDSINRALKDEAANELMTQWLPNVITAWLKSQPPRPAPPPTENPPTPPSPSPSPSRAVSVSGISLSLLVASLILTACRTH